MATRTTTPSTYGEKVLKVEPYGVEPVAQAERHGHARSQFTLWLGSNLTIADYALGFLPISLGLPWSWTIAAVLVGNLLGALVLALCAAMGPSYGVPQLMIGKFSFGRVGGMLPALFNYVSTIGWFTVNNILGTFGLRVLFPHLAFWEGSLLLVVIQGALAIYGHNLIHSYERIMSVVLGVLFLVVTFIALSHHAALLAYHPATKNIVPLFLVMVGAAFSYVGSWGPYASDYSRYLPVNTAKSRVRRYAFAGSFIASVWLELVGAAVAILAGPHGGDAISSLHSVSGAFGTFSVIAIILGGTAADALNLYSNALSAGAIGIRLPRFVLAAVASGVGFLLSVWGSGAFESNFTDFLLLIGYWMTPWVAILFVDFYVLRRWRAAEVDLRNRLSVYWPGLWSFLLGIAISLPFMSATKFEGPVAKAMGGTDLAFYVGFLVAGTVYFLWTRNRSVAVASS